VIRQSLLGRAANAFFCASGAHVLKRTLRSGSRKTHFRYGLATLQWAISLMIIIGNAVAADKPSVPFQHDNRTPIDITADQLDVLQADSKATFSGNVVAIQGDVRLTAEKMTVYYRKQGQSEAQAKGKAAGEANAIRRIEVEKNVFLSTPGETASGASGVYDIEKNQIMLDKNVVLTRDKNTLKGDHLTYDFGTGKSTLTSAGGAVDAGGRGKGRVRALFIPDNNDTMKPGVPSEKQ
jgi:lipopolysaccharide export system protein LptA